ncbi:MAG TPA: metallophosphoesterase family protein [Chloroflexota bacterium]|nr:metallophosphoesterase family protein [Chloroflexota bacterium]
MSRDSHTIWGLVSDVHGNYPALEQALGLLGAAGAGRIACLGDYLGRGDNERCVARIRDVAEVVILGNRDLDWQDRVSAAARAWVLELPRTACVGPLLLAHGDARLTPALSTSQIGRDFVRTWHAMQRTQTSVFAFGHSHHARTWRKASVAEPAELVAASQAVTIQPSFRYFLNVGTTGLPFPGKGGPSVAVVDFALAQIRHLNVDPMRIDAE